MGTISDFVIHQYYIIFIACEMRCCVVNMWNEQFVYQIFIKFKNLGELRGLKLLGMVGIFYFVPLASTQN